MDITIFKDLTTNEYLDQLKEESEKYTGLYVDMNNAPERKYVKDKAYDIQQLLKKIDRKRIDASKEYKAKIESEAFNISVLLKAANEPFTLLIDEHKAERAKILADKKIVEELKELAIKKEDDHEIGLLMNKTYEFDKAEAELAKGAELAKIKLAAGIEAAFKQERLNKQEAQDKINAENARLANKEHVRGVNNDILHDLLNTDCGLEEDQAKAIITAMARNKISHTTINY